MVNKCDGFQGRFRSKMPSVYKKLREASLTAEPQITGHGGPPISFEGAAFFVIEDVPERFQIALREIDLAIAIARGQAQSDMGARTVNLRKAREHLDEVARALRALRAFFMPKELMYFSEAISAISRLLGRGGNRRYFAEGHKIVDASTGETLSLPDDYRVISSEPLRSLCNLKPLATSTHLIGAEPS